MIELDCTYAAISQSRLNCLMRSAKEQINEN